MLKGKLALITGASSGIGRIIALQFAEKGADIAVNYIDIGDIKKDAEAVVKELQDMGVKADMFAADVSDEDQVNAMFKEVTDKMGAPDILVNNAGITKDTLVMRMKAEDWDAVLNVNLRSAFLCSKAAFKGMMKKKYGKIVNISSIVGFTGNPGQANYVASKAGLVGLTKTCAQEFAARGVRVNAVAPGFIKTAMTEKLPEDVKNAMMAKIALSEFGTAEDVAKAAVFLAGEDSDYITGQTVHVNGGMYM